MIPAIIPYQNKKNPAGSRYGGKNQIAVIKNTVGFNLWNLFFPIYRDPDMVEMVGKNRCNQVNDKFFVLTKAGFYDRAD